MAQRRGQAPIADPLDNLIAGIDRTLAPPPAPRAVAPPADLDALIGSIDQLLAPPARPRGLNAGGTFTGPVRVTEPPGAIPPPPAVPETFTPRPPVTPAPDVRDLTILGRMAKGYGADVQAQEQRRLRAEAQRKAAQRALPPTVATLQKATSIGPAPPREPSVLQRSLAAAARVNPLVGGIEAAANVVPALSGAFHALPTAIGEQIAGQDLPGHQGEAVAGPVPTERGSLAYGSGQETVIRHPLVERLLSHAKMILSGEGGGVQPIGLVRATTNPPDTAVATEPGTLAYGSGQTAVTRGRIGQIAVETGRRGLDLVAQLLTDPTTVAAMGVRGEAGDLLAAAFTVDGVTTAARVAHDPKSTPEDVAEATLGAAIMAVPMAARHGVPKLREYVHAAAERARTADAARVADQALGYQGPEFAKPVGQGISEGVGGRRPPESPAAGTPLTPRTPPPTPPTPDALVAQIDRVLAQENVRVPELGPNAVTPAVYPGPERRHAARIATPEADARYQQMREKIARGERTGTEEARADFAERQRVEAERQRLAEAAAVRDLEQATPEDLVDHIDTVLQEGGHASQEQSDATRYGDRGAPSGAVVRQEPGTVGDVPEPTARLREHKGEGVAPARREDADHPQGEAVVTLSEISASVQEAAVGGANDMRGSSDGVPQSMRTRRLDREVVDPIIGAIPVDVVNVLGGEQRSTEALLHNPAVFARLLTAVPNVDVPTLAGSLGTVIADRRAELSGPRSGRGSAEYSAALEAFDRHLREAVARSTTPEATAAVLPRESLPVTTPRTEAPASSPDLTRINQEGVVTVPTGTTDLHDISLPRPSTAATQERPTRKVKPPKPTGDAATWVGPQQIGGRYRSGYWGKEYTVESIARDARGAPKSMTIRWEDGDVTTHQTAWDRKRDKVIQQPEAPAGEVQKTPLPPSTEILKGQTPVTTKETPRISPSVPPSIGGLLERKEAEVTPSGKMSPTVTPSRGPGNISTPQNPPEPEGGTSQEGVAPSGIYYFHGTTQKYLPRILKRGLQVQKAGANWSQSQQQAYVTDNRFDARTWAHEASRRTGSVLADTPIVLKLDIPDADIARLERDFSSDAYGRFSLPDDIPSKWIVGYSVRQADGTWSDIEVRHKKQRPNLSGSPQRGESALSPTASTPKARLQIRQGEYRDKPGFHITGKDAKGHPVQIFTETRESAEHIKAELQRGEDTTVADFEVGKPVETPADAAKDVLAEVRRVVDTKGAKSAGGIHQRVLSALEEELKTAPNTQGYTTLEVRRTKAYGGREGSVWVDGDPVASYDRYGTLKWNDEASAYTEQRNGAPHYVPAVPSKRDTVHLGRDLSAGEMEKAARAAVANALKQGEGGRLTVEIPGDGTFTIHRNANAIQEVIDRIRKGGVSPWHGIVLKGPTPKVQPKFDRPWGTLPVSGRVKINAMGGSTRWGARSSSGGGIQSAIVPGLKEFVEQDVVPGLKTASEQVGAARRDLRALFAPDTSGTPAVTFAGVMRANLAAYSQRIQRAQRNLRSLERAFDKRADKENVAFIDAIEEGEIDRLPADIRPAAETLRSLLDAKRREVQKRGRLRQYIEHYFPHEWKEPGQVKKFIDRLMGRRPLQGPKSFLKKRSIPTVREGLELGLEPYSYNPVTLVLRKLTEMDKWVMAYDVLHEARSLGVAKFVRIGDKAPEGWVRYHDSFGTVYGKPTIPIQEAYDAKLMEGLHTFAQSLGVKTVRKVKIGGTRWGYAVGKQEIVTKFAGPETVLEHEIGHILDETYGLRQQWVTNPKMKQELRDLADLRHEGTPRSALPKSKQAYYRKGEEKIANLVHAFLYAPERTKKVAPNAYWALYNLAKAHNELRPLLDLQKARSLTLAVDTAETPVGGMVVSGHYYGPPEATRLLNNYLSPGLRGNIAFDLYRRAGNFMNQVQLGISAFHLTMTGLEAVVSKAAQALQEIERGVGLAVKGEGQRSVVELLQAGKHVAETPVATLTTLLKGHQALKALYEQDANAKTIASITDLIIQGGGGVGWDRLHHDAMPEAVMQALRQGNILGAAWRTVPAFFELMAKPIMEWWVPRLKLGAYLDLARMELRTLGPDPSVAEVRRVLGKTWDSIDNRFGELRYDNLFWHTALKDFGMASVRALGWNVGTVREVFGAPTAQVGRLLHGTSEKRHRQAGYDKEGRRIFEEETEPWLTNKGAYVIAMVMMYGLLGALYQYLHTGEAPSELKDYFFPKTGHTKTDGSPERVSIPGYFKDSYAVLHDLPGSAITTAGHKLHPLLNALYELFTNENYFGTEIRTMDAPYLQQLQEVFDYMAETLTPISFRNYNRRKESLGGSGISGVESVFGISEAPASVSRSKAEALVRQYLPPSHKTREQAAQMEERRKLREALRSGQQATARDIVGQGTLSKRQIETAARSANLTSLQRSFGSLTLEQALNVYDVATPEERLGLWTMLQRKAMNAVGNLPPAEQADLVQRVRKATTLPRRAPHGQTPVTVH
jgi:hypothetical protein